MRKSTGINTAILLFIAMMIIIIVAAFMFYSRPTGNFAVSFDIGSRIKKVAISQDGDYIAAIDYDEDIYIYIWRNTEGAPPKKIMCAILYLLIYYSLKKART